MLPLNSTLRIPSAPDDPAADDLADARWLAAQADRLRAAVRRTARGLLAVGRVLAAVRARLPDRRFHAWLAEHWPYSRRTAYRRIAAAEQLAGLCQNGTDALDAIHPAAVAVLVDAAPEVRAEALRLAAAGHPVTAAAVRALARRARPPRAAPTAAADVNGLLRLLIPAGERHARFDLRVRLDPDGDLVVGVGPADGRDLVAVLKAVAGHGSAPAVAAPRIDPGPHLEWAQAIGLSIAGEYGFRRRSAEADAVRAEAVAAVLEKARQFDPARVPPGGDASKAFRGWAHPSVRTACRRECARLRNGGVYRTTRTPAFLSRSIPRSNCTPAARRNARCHWVGAGVSGKL